MPPRFSGTPLDDEPASPPATGPRFSGTLVEDPTDAPAAGVPGDGAAAIGRGIVNGIPVAGPYLLGGLNRVAAGIRSLKNDTRYSDELANVERFGEATARENPKAALAGEIAGGVVGTAPLIAAAPAAFGVSAASLPVRMLASGASGGVLGGADAAVRSDGDLGAIKEGATVGAGLGLASPVAGQLIGRAVGAFTGGGKGHGLMREALEGVSDKDLEAAQALMNQARSLPGSPVPLTLDEALNAVTGGQATRASALARVVANSGGEGGQTMSRFYAERPASIDNAGRAALEAIGPQPASPTAVGFEAQAAARRAIDQTPEGMALAQAREAVGPRVTPDTAGQVIQREMRGVADAREARRTEQAARDYAAAREAPENIGIERTITVERPGEPVITYPEGGPQFTDAAPRPLGPAPTVEAEAAAGPESLARFIARNGGLPLDGDVVATDLQRFNIPGLGNVAREGGRSIDNHWREALIEAGYFRRDPDGGAARNITNELLRRLQNEQRGFPSYPIGTELQGGPRVKAGQVTDEYRAALSQAESRLDGDLARAGVDPASLHPEIRARTLGALMRGEVSDPLDAYERVVAGMREPPAPYVKSTTVQEQIPDVRFGQVDPQAALDVIDRQLLTAKGDVRSALKATRRDLLENRIDSVSGVRERDLSVDGLHQARERLDHRVTEALDRGDGILADRLVSARTALDEALKSVPEMALADANFAAASRPLDVFAGDAPLGRITRQDPRTGRMATPSEQVPSHLQGASAARELLANATPAAREAYEGRVATQILDGATDARGRVNPDRLAELLRDNADVLGQMPRIYDRLDAVVRARDGLARVQASPLGIIAERPDTKAAIRALFPENPMAGSHADISAAVGGLARNNPGAARDLVRIYLEGMFNEATQSVKGVARQYGGAGFASAVRGNAQQRHNLEAALRALPAGDDLVRGFDRLLSTLEATGYRPVKGSDTAFNQAIQARLATGTGPIATAITEAAAGAAAGAGLAGPGGAAGGALVGLRKAATGAWAERRLAGNGAAIARMLTDPKALPELRALARSKPGSRNAEMFTQRLLLLANGGAGPARDGSAGAR
ncbi:hypothetical protein [Methylobacterium organophilum]|uniref:Uncharacterized protein n=1 Tax=Methylobacterium organophilum TaxID=410 RepID=A0ABQ4TIG4_METOR|nr:hypothetical protein [Methylobacterium organophilum]GJE29812.1 hypothetical protein LKMONMHP_4698 [Methylobacterium organophilum]